MTKLLVREAIKELRENVGLNQEEFAKRINLYTLAVSHLETGRRKMNARTALELEVAFGVQGRHLGSAEYWMDLQSAEDIDVEWVKMQREKEVAAQRVEKEKEKGENNVA